MEFEKTYIIIDSLMFTRYDNQLEDLLMKHKEYGIEVILVMDAPMNLSTKIKSNIVSLMSIKINIELLNMIVKIVYVSMPISQNYMTILILKFGLYRYKHIFIIIFNEN